MNATLLPKLSVTAALLAVLGTGCAPHDDTSETDEPHNTAEASSTSAAEKPGIDSAGDVNPIEAQMWLDDFTIGKAAQTDQSISAADQGDDFAPGAPVFVSMEVGDAPAAAKVRVDVLNEDGDDTPVASQEQAVPAGAHYMSFKVDTKSWPKGDYRAEVWIGDERVNEQHFQIVDAANAGR
jgi:hypothetical protein